MWYAQERFNPVGMVDLATLTGAVIIGLGHEKAGVFSNDDAFCNAFLKAATREGEGAWRMPLGQAYDELLKSPHCRHEERRRSRRRFGHGGAIPAAVRQETRHHGFTLISPVWLR